MLTIAALLLASLLLTSAATADECISYAGIGSAEDPRPTLVVNVLSGLRARSEPNTSSEIVATLPYREPLILFEKCGDWARIESDSGHGWVYVPLTCTDRLYFSLRKFVRSRAPDRSFRPICKMEALSE